MAPSSIQTFAVATLALLTTANSMDESANITSRQAVPADKVIAQIVWFSGADCDFSQSDKVLYYNVGTSDANNNVNSDGCDAGRPSYTNFEDGGNLGIMEWSPASFFVASTPQTCNPDVNDGEELASVRLYPSCQPKTANADSDPNLYCPGECTVEGWSVNDGYSTCVNTPEFAASTGVWATAITQNIRFC